MATIQKTMTRRGGVCLIVNDFSYRLDSATKDGTKYWRCTSTGCTSRCKTDEDAAELLTSPTTHNHNPDQRDIQKRMLRALVKQRAELDFSEAPSSIIKSELLQMCDDNHLLTEKDTVNVRRSIYRQRMKKLQPAIPKKYRHLKTPKKTMPVSRLSARTILVTGASRGLGLELVTQLLGLPQAPEILIAACRSPENALSLQELAKTHSSLRMVKLDVVSPLDIDSAFKETASILGDKGLNLLINNAAIYDKTIPSDFKHIQRDVLNEHFNVNCTAPVMLTQKFLPLIERAAAQSSEMLSCSQAGVVMMSTVMGSMGETLLNGRGDSLSYKCSKSALNMATLLMSRELSPQGILVMGVHPGWVQTDMGGAGGPLMPAESVAHVLQVIGQAGAEHCGRTTNYEGKILPL